MLADKHKKYRKAALDVLWDNDRQLFISGKERQVSFASQVWMVLGGAVEGETASKLLEQIKKQSDAIGMVTPYMYHNYIDALITAGDANKALEVIKSYFGGMAELGADTFWEIYNPENPDESPYGGTIVNSYCHAWSCAPAYFLRKYFSK